MRKKTLNLEKLIREIQDKIFYLQDSIDREMKSDLPKTYFTQRLIAEDKQKVKVLKLFLQELYKLSSQGKKTISSRKAEKLLKDIIYKKLHLAKSPFKDIQ